MGRHQGLGQEIHVCFRYIYLITLLTYLCGIITNLAINAPIHGKNVVDGLNATDKCYLKGESNLLEN